MFVLLFALFYHQQISYSLKYEICTACFALERIIYRATCLITQQKAAENVCSYHVIVLLLMIYITECLLLIYMFFSPRKAAHLSTFLFGVMERKPASERQKGSKVDSSRSSARRELAAQTPQTIH